VNGLESYQKMLSTGVDGVMIGRGAQGRPWLFQELQGKDFDGDKFEIIKRHTDILLANYDQQWATLYMRKHFLWYASGVEGVSKYRIELATSDSIDKSLEILKEIMSK
ncbi:MAG: tRNA-dihydrouridine synthase, partial [Clostridia bacterium]|nr:tRNA-dihydrouridine synthase [Clostridia bacterium]